MIIVIDKVAAFKETLSLVSNLDMNFIESLSHGTDSLGIVADMSVDEALTGVQYNMGTGNSMSNMLMWIATQSDPIPINPDIVATNRDPVPTSCAGNSACVTLGMVGDCCPHKLDTNSSHNMYLGCCPVIMP